MKLRIKPHISNDFEFGGFLIQNASVKEWIFELQRLDISLNSIRIYPIPNTTPNSIWGCFVSCSQQLTSDQVGKNELCQRVISNLYIPEKTKITPPLSSSDLSDLLSKSIHIIHPEFGWVELAAPISIIDHITFPTEKYRYTFKPEDSVFIPKKIDSFQIKPVPNEDPIKAFEEKIVKEREQIPHKPLNALEKIKLFFYNKTLKLGSNNKVSSNIIKTLDQVSGTQKKWGQKIKSDFKDLEDRNQNEIEKLIQLLNKNPEEALKYAIPMSETFIDRGTPPRGSYRFSQIWSGLKLNSRNLYSNASHVVDLGDYSQTLNHQYLKTAESLIQDRNYEKAAFVYIKLLKNYNLGAQTLENGGLYEEAAAIYLKHLKNKEKAAECYEKAKMIDEAIKIHLELHNYEKVGDLYISITRHTKALKYFKIAAENFITQNKYFEAALIYKNKINDYDTSQSILLEGWTEGIKNHECLNTYFSNIKNNKERLNVIQNIAINNVQYGQYKKFLKIVHHQQKIEASIAIELRDIAYELVAKVMIKNPDIVNELNKFNPKNMDFGKDTFRFKKGMK